MEFNLERAFGEQAKLVSTVASPVSSADVDTYGRLQDIFGRSYKLRTVISAWEQQQIQERSLRSYYARIIFGVLIAQVVAINVFFVLLGRQCLSVEKWTANTFIFAVFAEIASMTLVVIRYLFPKPGNDLEVIARIA